LVNVVALKVLSGFSVSARIALPSPQSMAFQFCALGSINDPLPLKVLETVPAMPDPAPAGIERPPH
jgi:hypothetical protein